MIVTLPPGTVVQIEWNIIEVQLTRTKHFVGFSLNDKLGRISTPIFEFDEITFEGKTRSGSIYFPKEAPGKVHDDALYVLEMELDPFHLEYKWIYPGMK